MYSALLFSSMIGGYANTTVDVKDMVANDESVEHAYQSSLKHTADTEFGQHQIVIKRKATPISRQRS